MLKFRLSYFILTVLLFSIEVLIALFVHDSFIRPHIGDFLAVILIYCFMRSFFNLSIWWCAVFTFCLASTFEILQYFKIVEKLGLQDSKLAVVIIGTTFNWIDLLMYAAGITFVLVAEKNRQKNKLISR